MKASIIISTYNQPEWLEKTLIGYRRQEGAEFDLIVADDGSDERTANLIRSCNSDLPLRHVWHPDEGFRKNTILNKAASFAESEYLIFTDGDCIPRSDFVSTHLRKAEPGRFLSGGAVRLNMAASRQIRADDIVEGRCFDPRWLESVGQPFNRHRLKLARSSWLVGLLNRIAVTRITWNGNNSSCWRSDFEMVNGFDERMSYGGEDREFGERLMNAGIRGKPVRYSAVLVHLDHSRPYVTPGMFKQNRRIRRETRREKLVRTRSGVRDEDAKDSARM